MIGGVRPWPCRLVRLTVAMASVLAALSMLVAACSATRRTGVGSRSGMFQRFGVRVGECCDTVDDEHFG